MNSIGSLREEGGDVRIIAATGSVAAARAAPLIVAATIEGIRVGVSVV